MSSKKRRRKRKPHAYTNVVSGLVCPDCGSPMSFQTTGRFAPNYVCDAECGSAHGAHPDGSPLGIPGDKATRIERMAAHKKFDKFARQMGWTRSESYAWLQQVMGMDAATAHFARFDIETCKKLIGIINEENAKLSSAEAAASLRRKLAALTEIAEAARDYLYGLFASRPEYTGARDLANRLFDVIESVKGK